MTVGPVTRIVSRELRANAGRRRLSASEISRLSGLSRTMVSRTLSGATAITLDAFVPIVAALNRGDQEHTLRALVAEIRASTHRGEQVEEP